VEEENVLEKIQENCFSDFKNGILTHGNSQNPPAVVNYGSVNRR